MNVFDAAKVFSATKHKERDELGERLSKWVQSMGDQITIVDKVVKQSSDNEYHCVTIVLFYTWND